MVRHEVEWACDIQTKPCDLATPFVTQYGELPKIVGCEQCHDKEKNVYVGTEGFFDMSNMVQHGSKLFNVVHYLNLGLCVWGGVHRTELAIEVLEVACLADHGRIVGSVGEWRNMYCPTMATT